MTETDSLPPTCERRGCLTVIAGFVVALLTYIILMAIAHAESGIASIYAYRGERTASGERASPSGLTAAHKTMPFNAIIRVTNRRNGRSVVVVSKDRGPFVKHRIIDLTPAGARALGFSGLAPVTVERVR